MIASAFPGPETTTVLTSMGYQVRQVSPTVVPRQTDRRIVAVARAAKSHMTDTDTADALLAEGLRVVRSSPHYAGKLLVVTHKAVADRWRTDPPSCVATLCEQIDIAHYGAVRGLNKWRGWSTLSVGDPWLPPAVAEVRAAYAEVNTQSLWTHDVADRLGQSHGRGRPLRDGPISQVHVGRVAPAGWTDAAGVIGYAGPRSGNITAQEVADLVKKAGSQTALADLSGVTRRTIGNIIGGQTRPSKSTAEKLRAVLLPRPPSA